MSEELKKLEERRTGVSSDTNTSTPSVYDQYPPAGGQQYGSNTYRNSSYGYGNNTDVQRELERLREANYELQQKLYDLERGNTQQGASLAVPPAN